MAAFGEFGSQCYRVMFYDNEIEAIWIVDPATGARIQTIDTLTIYPARLFVTTKERINAAVQQIYLDLGKQIEFFEREGRTMEAQRIKQRVEYDLEMIKELGYCPGCLLLIDESHVTLPQVHGMFGGDRARKENLVEYGFRLPAAKDNRPLRFEEFEQMMGTTVYISATPADYELMKSEGVVVEQLIRPTGLVDPPLEVRVTENQIDDLLEEIDKRVRVEDKVLITTITKRMAEELSKYFDRIGVRNRYIHSDIDTLERIQILEDLRAGMFDVLIGVNLLREGLAQRSGTGQSTLLASQGEKIQEAAPAFYLPAEDRYMQAADVQGTYVAGENLDTLIAKAKEDMERAAKSLDFLAAAKYRDRMYELQKLREENRNR